MNLDVLVFAAHPDDAELAMGGTIAKLTADGIKVGIADLSQGEMGTRGSAEIRKEEARKAGEVLNLTTRVNLGLPDGKLKVTEDHTKAVVSAIRKYRPKIIFAPYFNDRHPDHIGTSRIVKEALFFSGVEKYETKDNGEVQERYRPHKLYHFMQTYEFTPSFIVDISDTFENKMEAMKSYGTQFFNSKSKEPETFISQLNFIKFIEARGRYYGFKIGKDFGEPFYAEEMIELDFSYLLKKIER